MATRAKTPTKKRSTVTKKATRKPTKKAVASKPKSNKLHHRAQHHVKKHIMRYITCGAALFLLSFAGMQSIGFAASSKGTGTVNVTSYYKKCKYSKKKFKGAIYIQNVEQYVSCKVAKNSKANLNVSLVGSGQCNGKGVGSAPGAGDNTNFGSKRKITCTPGRYTFALDDGANLNYGCGSQSCTAHDRVTVNISSKSKTNIVLGTNQTR